jgi:hypothetical protein
MSVWETERNRVNCGKRRVAVDSSYLGLTYQDAAKGRLGRVCGSVVQSNAWFAGTVA